jgi:hypothetical protein
MAERMLYQCDKALDKMAQDMGPNFELSREVFYDAAQVHQSCVHAHDILTTTDGSSMGGYSSGLLLEPTKDYATSEEYAAAVQDACYSNAVADPLYTEYNPVLFANTTCTYSTVPGSCPPVLNYRGKAYYRDALTNRETADSWFQQLGARLDRVG